MKAPMPPMLKHHQDPLVFLHQTNTLRQQGLDPGAAGGDGLGGVQGGSASPAGPRGQQVPGGSSGWSSGCIPRAIPSPQSSPKGAHPGAQGAAGEAPGWALPRSGKRAGAAPRGASGRHQGQGSAPAPTSTHPRLSASRAAALSPCCLTGDTPAPVPRDPDQPQPRAAPSETCRDSLLP